MMGCTWLASTADLSPAGLSPAGWFMMVLCVGFVTGLAVFCFYRILREPAPSKHHHAPLDIDTHDRDD